MIKSLKKGFHSSVKRYDTKEGEHCFLSVMEIKRITFSTNKGELVVTSQKLNECL